MRNFALFHHGAAKTMITTNLLSRSIDVPDVKMIVNFDPPINVKSKSLDTKTYIQRIGRAGRFGKLQILFINLIFCTTNTLIILLLFFVNRTLWSRCKSNDSWRQLI